MSAREGMSSELSYYKQWDVYWDYYVPLSHTLANVQHRGIPLDIDRREELIVEYEDAIDKAQVELDDLVGRKFNIKSKKDMEDYVHGYLKLPKQKKKEKTARASTHKTKQHVPPFVVDILIISNSST